MLAEFLAVWFGQLIDVRNDVAIVFCFPEPLRPTMAIISPGRTSIETFSESVRNSG